MGVEESLNQIVQVPLATIYGSFIFGCFFYFILDGVSGIISCIVAKIIQKIKDKKENTNQNV